MEVRAVGDVELAVDALQLRLQRPRCDLRPLNDVVDGDAELVAEHLQLEAQRELEVGELVDLGEGVEDADQPRVAHGEDTAVGRALQHLSHEGHDGDELALGHSLQKQLLQVDVAREHRAIASQRHEADPGTQVLQHGAVAAVHADLLRLEEGPHHRVRGLHNGLLELLQPEALDEHDVVAVEVGLQRNTLGHKVLREVLEVLLRDEVRTLRTARLHVGLVEVVQEERDTVLRGLRGDRGLARGVALKELTDAGNRSLELIGDLKKMANVLRPLWEPLLEAIERDECESLEALGLGPHEARQDAAEDDGQAGRGLVRDEDVARDEGTVDPCRQQQLLLRIVAEELELLEKLLDEALVHLHVLVAAAVTQTDEDVHELVDSHVSCVDVLVQLDRRVVHAA
eukprot:PhM_4_TR14152/c0_g1_i1/m.51543